jgi:hypothetical protein
MSDLPEPLTPPDCDLRGYDYMPLYGQRLFGSRFYSLSLRNPRAGLAGLKLWWEAWNQCPAGSLPDDDFDLARLADFGGDMKAWRAVKESALHGFIKCSDGRLYNIALSQHAIEAYETRLRASKKRDADRERLRIWREKKLTGSDGGNTSGNEPETRVETADETYVETAPETLVETRFVAGGSEVKRSEVSKEDNRSLRSLPRQAGAAEAFDDFWAAYPRKVGKEAARKAWLSAIKRHAPADIATGLNRQVWNADPQFIPHPATWLNQGRWQDDPGASAPAPQPKLGRLGQLRADLESAFSKLDTSAQVTYDA